MPLEQNNKPIKTIDLQSLIDPQTGLDKPSDEIGEISEEARLKKARLKEEKKHVGVTGPLI
ncbi:hypothetical protein HON22_04785 [Candidatus Peregrinibacteria bacterium]|jgi:hypothetical protein|nr:hypothetical protein [Candidatus Peregrinibacteria bacterium]